MLSKNKIKFRSKKKTSNANTDVINLALKNKKWHSIAQILSSSTRNYSSVNLAKIDIQTTAGDTVVIPGKVLGSGDLTKKVRVCALGFSQSALNKMKKTKSEAASLIEEVKKNPKGEGIKIIL